MGNSVRHWTRTAGYILLGVIILGALFLWNNEAIAPLTAPPVDTSTPPPSTQTYTCPESEYVDCMPIVPPEKQWMCEEKYLAWAQENCSGFRGVAY